MSGRSCLLTINIFFPEARTGNHTFGTWRATTWSIMMSMSKIYNLIFYNYRISFNDSVSDVGWNPKYHMIAVSGFGKNYPILIYIWEKSGELTA